MLIPPQGLPAARGSGAWSRPWPRQSNDLTSGAARREVPNAESNPVMGRDNTTGTNSTEQDSELGYSPLLIFFCVSAAALLAFGLLSSLVVEVRHRRRRKASHLRTHGSALAPVHTVNPPTLPNPDSPYSALQQQNSHQANSTHFQNLHSQHGQPNFGVGLAPLDSCHSSKDDTSAGDVPENLPIQRKEENPAIVTSSLGDQRSAQYGVYVGTDATYSPEGSLRFALSTNEITNMPTNVPTNGAPRCSGSELEAEVDSEIITTCYETGCHVNQEAVQVPPPIYTPPPCYGPDVDSHMDAE